MIKSLGLIHYCLNICNCNNSILGSGTVDPSLSRVWNKLNAKSLSIGSIILFLFPLSMPHCWRSTESKLLKFYDRFFSILTTLKFWAVLGSTVEIVTANVSMCYEAHFTIANNDFISLTWIEPVYHVYPPKSVRKCDRFLNGFSICYVKWFVWFPKPDSSLSGSRQHKWHWVLQDCVCFPRYYVQFVQWEQINCIIGELLLEIAISRFLLMILIMHGHTLGAHG